MVMNAIALLFVFLTASPLAPRAVRLFDGKTFSGWEGDLKYFRIQDGAIVGGSLKQPLDHNEFLCTKKTYMNFTLRLKFKLLGEGVNGGVQIRSRRVPNNREVSGFQADLGDNYWGSLYDESRRNKTLIAPDPRIVAKVLKREQWNDYEIQCIGSQIRIWLNGKLTVDYTEKDSLIPDSGIIGLQIHAGKPTEAWYKDIFIEELPWARDL